MLGWLNDNQGAAIAILTLVLVVATLWYTAVTHRLFSIAERQALAASQPVVAFSAGEASGSAEGGDNVYAFDIEVVNVGVGPASAVSAQWEAVVRSELKGAVGTTALGVGQRTAIRLRIRYFPVVFMQQWATETPHPPGQGPPGIAGRLVVRYRDVNGRDFLSTTSASVAMRGNPPRAMPILDSPTYEPPTERGSAFDLMRRTLRRRTPRT